MSSPTLEVALFATVWLALVLFVIGEAGKPSASRQHSSRGWAWTIWTAGALLLALHILVALGVRHGWSHGSAVLAVREQTRTFYGLDWGGGVLGELSVRDGVGRRIGVVVRGASRLLARGPLR